MMKPKITAKRKRYKPKQRVADTEKPNPFLDYGNSWPRRLAHEIRDEISDGNRYLEEMVNAIHSVDQYHLPNPRSTKGRLIDLLSSRGTSAMENRLLADLIDRVVFDWPVGARRRPAYLISHDNEKVLNALADVAELLASDPRLQVADAVERAAGTNKIPFGKLLDARQGRSRLTRKKKR